MLTEIKKKKLGNAGNLLLLISNILIGVTNYIYQIFACFYLAFVSGLFVFPYANNRLSPCRKGKMGFEVTESYYWEQIYVKGWVYFR